MRPRAHAQSLLHLLVHVYAVVCRGMLTMHLNQRRLTRHLEDAHNTTHPGAVLEARVGKEGCTQEGGLAQEAEDDRAPGAGAPKPKPAPFAPCT